MGVRSALNEHRRVTLAFFAVALVAAVTAAWTSSRPPTASLPSQIYYSDDDGQSFFADDSSKIPPLDHNGKSAFVAAVFQCGNGQPFVGYLIRYTQAGKAALEQFSASRRIGSDPEVIQLKLSESQIKWPGQKKWVSPGDTFTGMLHPPCPSGESGIPQEVFPR